MKSRIVFVVKLLVAALLIGWLLKSGNLDLGALKMYGERPVLLASALALFAFGACVSTARFGVLLGLADVELPFSILFRLQMTAFFFNVVIPGNIGGDVVKALYVARDAAPTKRTTIVLLAFVERLVGVAALVLLGALIAAVRAPILFADPVLRPLASAVLLIGILTLLGGIAGIVIVRRGGGWLESLTSGPSRLSKLLNQLVASMRLVSADPKRILKALGLSMLYHAGAIILFTVLAEAIIGNVPKSAVAAVFPLGMLALLLPISPAGLGVGHVAFQRLFDAIGLPGGATIFNVYLLSQITPCLLGVFPFLALRKELPTEVPQAPT